MKHLVFKFITGLAFLSAGILIASRIVFEKVSKVSSSYLRSFEDFDKEKISDLYIQSRDEKRLHATLLKPSEDSKLCVMLIHGLGDGNIERTMEIARFYYDRGVSVLLTDQRGYGLSKGEYITFGALESKDHMGWLEVIREELGDDVKILIHGLSMGAATALMMCRNELPANVKGIIADSSYSKVKDIIKFMARKKHIPERICYSLYKLACFAGSVYDPERARAIDGAEKVNLPIIFAHAVDDSVVPFEMTEEMYEICPSINKKLIALESDEHACCFNLSEEMRIFMALQG